MTVIGIDLGTTNSAMAIYEEGQATIIVNGSDQRTTPSVFQVKPNNEEVIGSSAKKGAASLPDRTVLEIKRKMGEDIEVQIAGKAYRPEEVSSKLLRYLKNSAEEKLGTTVEEAVITVPAYFTDAQRKSTKVAGELAGLRIERIINEPTAAALAFCHEHLEKDRNLLVYDLGGGTFDVSVVELFDGIVEVKASTGNNHLGGTDFDQAIITYIETEFEQMNGYTMASITQDEQMLFYLLKEAAEQAKIELSTQLETTIMIPFIGLKDNMPVSFSGTLTRSQLEKLTNHLVEATLEKVTEALQESAIEASAIDEVLMVGGSTRMPLVREKVAARFGDKLRVDINPDEVVASGAAIQAAIKTGEMEKTGLMAIDVCPFTLGISVSRRVDGEVISGIFDPIIYKNQAIPITKSHTYRTMHDNQTVIQLDVYQGDAEYCADNILLAEGMQITDLKAAPAGESRVQVSFTYDINGILQIEAENIETGDRVIQTIDSQKGVMTEPQRIASKKRMEEEEANADFIEQAKKSVYRANRMKEEFSASQQEEIGEIIRLLEQAIESGNTEDIRQYDQQLIDQLVELL